MSGYATGIHSFSLWGYLWRFCIFLPLCLLAECEIVSAQFVVADTAQPDLIKKSKSDQALILAGIVEKAHEGRKCSHANVSLENSYKDGGGAWLVLCDEGQDYWASIPAEPKKAATVSPCILARVIGGIECYASLRTILPEDIAQCSPKSLTLPDRMIRSCTTIIQSGRLDSQPAPKAAAYGMRAMAYASYAATDLALADLDRAIELWPDGIDNLFNRAVTLERKGDLDQAIRDLDRVLRLKPDHWQSFYERGFVYIKKHDYTRAIADFDQVLRLNPGYEKALQQRAVALQHKGNPVSAPTEMQSGVQPKPNAQKPSQDAATEVSETNRKAMYCMEATFGYLRQVTRLIPDLKDLLRKEQARIAQATPSEREKAILTVHIKSLSNDIASNEEKQRRWESDLKVFLAFLERRGQLKARTRIDNNLMAMSSAAGEDQKAVYSIYTSCLRQCIPLSIPCKLACSDKASSSESSKRMLECSNIAGNFK